MSYTRIYLWGKQSQSYTIELIKRNQTIPWELTFVNNYQQDPQQNNALFTAESLRDLHTTHFSPAFHLAFAFLDSGLGKHQTRIMCLPRSEIQLGYLRSLSLLHIIFQTYPFCLRLGWVYTLWYTNCVWMRLPFVWFWISFSFC